MVGAVHARGLLLRVVVEGTDPVEHGQEPAHDDVHLLLVHLARADGRGQVAAVEAGRAGHLQVEPGPGRACRRAHREPVADDEAVEPPLPPQDHAYELLVLGAVGAVEPVVGGHDPEGAALTDGQLEGEEVDLAQGPLVDHRVDGAALELGLVACEVLDRRGHALGLHPADEGGRGPSRQQRVLRVALEVAPGQRRPVDVDRGGEQDAACLAARLLAQHRPYLLNQVGVPRGAQGRSAGSAGRGGAPLGRQERPPGPVGSVRSPDGRDAQPFDGRGRPETTPPGEEALLLQGELGDELVEVAAPQAHVPPRSGISPPIESSGGAGGSGRSPPGRGQATGVTSLMMGWPTSMPARSTDGCGRGDLRVHPSLK